MTSFDRWYIASGKRLIDIIVAASALIVLLPLFLVLCVAIRVQDGAPIFYKHGRIGRNGVPFMLLKFRSMKNSSTAPTGEAPAGADLAQLAALRAQFQGTQKNDPRITRIGRFLRKTHLDELPQLINVLNGDMSIIGPRPDTKVQMADYHARTWERRHAVRPGITGLAQIMAHKVQTERDRQAFDMQYIRALSPKLDLFIVMKTVFKVFRASSF